MDELHILIEIILDDGIRSKATALFSLSVYGNVILIGEARDGYEELCNLNDRNSIKESHTLERYFKRFSEGHKLFDQQLKYQGKHKVGERNVIVYAFKAYQFRIYGTYYDIQGRKIFLGTACDPKKKQNKADANKLEKSAKETIEWLEKLNNGLKPKL